MATDYNAGDTADLYRQAKNTLPIYRVDTFSLMQRVGDVSGQAVLDIACGEGHFTRMLRRSGAARAVGMDISEAMIPAGSGSRNRRPAGYRLFRRRCPEPGRPATGLRPRRGRIPAGIRT